MSITVSTSENKEVVIHISDEMTIYTVLEQKNSLLPYLKTGHTIHVDLSDVSELDSAGIQLLIFLKKQALEIGAEFKLQHHSQAVFEVIELFKLTEFFTDPVVISAEWN
ncbi:STAS domain-containing protein [Vibrio sp. VB16]|uniref:STAS domain-containing protein n=1 Tax=Vibrio sp. VB16 TaxID=2785746 RepID=UPI0018A07F6D|nr:STAS domain-containing protein [Vibrio sp. VB16]UGA57483.1 STAS domain-containing protein [Vibrio sp. VB16]